MTTMGRTASHKPYRRPDRDGWWASIPRPGHKRRSRVMVATDAQGYETAVVNRQRLLDRQRMITDGLVTEHQAKAADARVLPLLDQLGIMLASPGLQRRTAKYRDELRGYVEMFCRDRNAKTYADLTPRAVRAWLSSRSEEVSAATHNHALARLRTFARWSINDGKLTDDPTAGIRRMNEDDDLRQPPRAMTHEELAALLKVAPPMRRLRYLFGARAGLRQTEVSKLTWAALDLDAGYLILKAKGTKSKRSAEIPLASEIIDLARQVRLADAMNETRVFAGVTLCRLTWLRDLERAGLITVNSPRALLERRRKAGGRTHYKPTVADPGVELIGYRDDRGCVLSIGSLRKTFGTHLAATEKNVSLVAALMRHTDPKLTLKLYTDPRLLDMRAAVDRISGGRMVAVSVQQNATPGNTLQHEQPRKKRQSAT